MRVDSATLRPISPLAAARRRPCMDVALLVFLILLNGVFAMSEMALTASRKARLQVMVEGERAGRAGGDGPARATRPSCCRRCRSASPRSACSTASSARPPSPRRWPHWLQQTLQHPAPGRPRISATALVVVIITFLTIIFGELVPKRLGQMYPETVARLVARPMNWLSTATRPFVWLLGASTEARAAPAGHPRRARRAASPRRRSPPAWKRAWMPA